MKEVRDAVAKLKRVVLFHPKPIVEELPAQYCVCRKGEDKKQGGESEMILCETCWEWFHFACVGLGGDVDVPEGEWKCEWCRDKPDKEGYQRWTTGRKKAKKRHVRDEPRRNGAAKGALALPRYSAPHRCPGTGRLPYGETRNARSRF